MSFDEVAPPGDFSVTGAVGEAADIEAFPALELTEESREMLARMRQATHWVFGDLNDVDGAAVQGLAEEGGERPALVALPLPPPVLEGGDAAEGGGALAVVTPKERLDSILVEIRAYLAPDVMEFASLLVGMQETKPLPFADQDEATWWDALISAVTAIRAEDGDGAEDDWIDMDHWLDMVASHCDRQFREIEAAYYAMPLHPRKDSPAKHQMDVCTMKRVKIDRLKVLVQLEGEGAPPLGGVSVHSAPVGIEGGDVGAEVTPRNPARARAFTMPPRLPASQAIPIVVQGVLPEREPPSHRVHQWGMSFVVPGHRFPPGGRMPTEPPEVQRREQRGDERAAGQGSQRGTHMERVGVFMMDGLDGDPV